MEQRTYGLFQLGSRVSLNDSATFVIAGMLPTLGMSRKWSRKIERERRIDSL